MITITELYFPGREGLNAPEVERWLSKNIPYEDCKRLMSMFYANDWILRDLLMHIYNWDDNHYVFNKLCTDVGENFDKMVQIYALDEPDLKSAEYLLIYGGEQDDSDL